MEGSQKEKIEIAKKMLKLKIDKETIAEATGLAEGQKPYLPHRFWRSASVPAHYFSPGFSVIPEIRPYPASSHPE